MGLQVAIEVVQLAKEFFDGAIVGGLGLGKATAVDPIVNPVVNFFVPGVDGWAQVWGVEVRLGMGRKVVAAIVEHHQDFGAFVVNDFLAAIVPQHRHRTAS